jgi:threonine/homoserine/homoserine lactone efflux protein
MNLMSPALLVTYLATVSIMMITPGPDMLFALSTGARSGPRAGFCAAVGAAISETVHITAAACGLAALFKASPVLYDGMRLVGAGYLLLLGIKALRSRDLDLMTRGEAIGPRRALLRGMLVNLLNPKMAMFTIAFLPQFVDPAKGNVIGQFAVLGAVFLALEIIVDGTVGILAGRIGARLTSRRGAVRKLNVVTGSIYIGLATRLAVSR